MAKPWNGESGWRNEIESAPELAESLKEQLIAFESTCIKHAQEDVTTTLDKEKLEHLKALGYLK